MPDMLPAVPPRPRHVALARYRPDLAALAFLAVMTAVFFWRILFTGDYTILSGYDGSVQWYAWYRFAATWIRQGVLPLWDPYVYGGHSFIGEAQAGLFYPLNLLQAFLVPAGQALSPSVIYRMAALHGFIAAASMYAFARVLALRRSPALLAAVVFAFGGFISHRLLHHISIYYGCVWLPLLLALFHLSVTRRQPLLAVGAGLGLGMVTLAGHTMPPVYSALLLAAYAGYFVLVAWRKRQGRAIWGYSLAMLAVTAIFAAGLAAVQLLPSLEYEQLALRWTGTPAPPLAGPARSPYWVAGGFYYLQPGQLVNFLIPGLNRPPEGSAYFGVLPVLLVAIGLANWRQRPVLFFALAGLLALLFAFGQNSIVHGLLWLVIPVLDRARIAVRALYIVTFCAALLAGWGMQSLLQPGAGIRRAYELILHYGSLALALLVVIAIALSVVAAQMSPPLQLDAFYSFLVIAVLALAALALWHPLRLAPRVWGSVVLAVVLVDLLSHGTANFQAIRNFDLSTNWSPEIYYKENGALRFLKQQTGYFRVDIQGDVLSPNIGDVAGIQTVDGHGNTMVKDFYDLRQLAWKPSRLYDMLNIRYIVTTDTIKTLPLVYDGDLAAGDLKVYENPSALPRAWLVHRVTELAPGPATLARLQAPDFDPAQEAIVASPVALSPAGSGGLAQITVYTLHAIAVRVECDTPALLVTSENYYPGWMVQVDGQPQPVVRVNEGLRGVAVPAGQHDVVFSYRPRSFFIGAAITCGTLFGAALLALAGFLARRRVLRGENGQAHEA